MKIILNLLKNPVPKFKCGHEVINPLISTKLYFRKGDSTLVQTKVKECRICHNTQGRIWNKENIPRKTLKRWKQVNGKRVYYKEGDL